MTWTREKIDIEAEVVPTGDIEATEEVPTGENEPEVDRSALVDVEFEDFAHM